METTNRMIFKEFLPTAFDRGDYATDDVIAFVLPLFREVLSFHESGQVGPFEREDSLFITGHRLDIDENFAHAPHLALSRVLALFDPVRAKNVEVVGAMKIRAE